MLICNMEWFWCLVARLNRVHYWTLYIVIGIVVISQTLLTFIGVSSEGIIRVTKYCPQNQTERGEIIILSDQADTQPFAICQQDQTFNFVQIATGIFRLKFQHSGNVEEECIPTLERESNEYRIEINIPTSQRLVTDDMHVTHVGCPIPTEDLSKYVTARDRSLDPMRLYNDDADSVQEFGYEMIKMRVHHQLNHENKTVNLKVTAMLISSRRSAEGITPVNCKLLYGANKYHILENGCGNGSLFPRSGCTIQGLVAWCPQFILPIYPLQGPLVVECIFGLCKEICDGFSCKQKPVEVIEVIRSREKVYLKRRWYQDEEVIDIIPAAKSPVEIMTDSPNNPGFEEAGLDAPVIVAIAFLVLATVAIVSVVLWCKFCVSSGAYRIRNPC